MTISYGNRASGSDTTPNGQPNAQVSVTLSGEHAQVALSEIIYQLGSDLQEAPHPWEERRGHTVALFEEHVARVAELVAFFAGPMRQFEEAGVIARNTAIMLVFDRTGEFGPLEPPTTGPVTVSWSTGAWEAIAEGLEDDHEEADVKEPVARAIRDQLPTLVA